MLQVLKLRRSLMCSAVCLALAPSGLAQESDGSYDLEEVVVVSQKQPYRGDVPLESLPQQVQVISGDLINQLGKNEFQGALDMAGGVARQNSFGGLWDSFAIRGFAGDENLPSGYLINGFSGGRGYSGNRDTSNIETIEVLKGPGSALYGRGEPGGTINVVTKKPQFEKEGYINASIGNYSTRRVEADYTNKLSDSVAFRINGAYKDAGSFRDTIETKKLDLTPSLLFVLSDKTSINYELEILDQETPFDRGIVAIDLDPEVVDVETFYGEPQDGPIKIKATGHQFLLQHDLDSGWSVLAGLGYRESSFEGLSSETELSGSRQILTRTQIQEAEGVGANQRVNRQRRERDYDATDLSARLELTGTFESGSMKHHFLAGVDAYDYELDTIQNRWRDGFQTSTYYVDLNNPIYGQAQDQVLGPNTDRLETQEAFGIYFQDQIDVSDRWKVLLGLRYDDFSQEITNRKNDPATVSTSEETALSPRFGVTFEATDNVSLYASYAEGFRPNSGADAYGNNFDPEESKSYEVGMKLASMDGRLNTTIAWFKMDKSNILTADPVNAGESAALGGAESKGLEIDITGELSDSVDMVFSYAYVDAGTTSELWNFDWWVTLPAGSELVNIPENSANLMLNKRFNLNGADANLGFTINYVDDRLGETIDPTYRLPSYTLLNVFGSYQMNKRVKLTMNIDNITDEKYYVSSYHKWWTTPGMPTSYTLGVTYDF
ncbi:MAG: TonB-dependent siderophore receptor [Porticoccaceae bacterium]|nr:TonB-dependent siderophore receptor [Porticoccaceae bacterium]